jgi:hypothetical protein
LCNALPRMMIICVSQLSKLWLCQNQLLPCRVITNARRSECYEKCAHTRERERVCDEQQHKNIVSVLKIVMPFVYSSFRLVNFFWWSRRCLFDGTATSVSTKTRKICTRKTLKNTFCHCRFSTLFLFEHFRRLE